MDGIISMALEVICMRGAAGIRLMELWPSLRPAVSSSGLDLFDTVKNVIWRRLASHPGLQFVISDASVVRQEVLQGAVEDLEKIGLSIVAEEHLRDSFMGLYDLKQAPHFEISQIQRRVLERLAMARSAGITQNELAKEFDIKGSNFFYVVRNLESQQLIVRQSTIVREKESLNVKKGPKGDHIVNTNLLRLSRFAKDVDFNPQQRIEITRSVLPEMLDESGDTEPCSSTFKGSEDCLKEDVHINDYIPAMKAICEKLESSKNKVDIVSGVKSALGYRKTTGHRAWRTILYRLKYSGLVEECQAEVNGKDVACLRLLKKFDPMYFQPKAFMLRSNNGTSSENLVKGGKRGQITDQLIEVPLEHQIFDMIDAAGKNGMTILELSSRLGINIKKLHKRIFSMREKFGIVSESEIYNKTQAYRLWTDSSQRCVLNKNASLNHNLLTDSNGQSSQSSALVPYECPENFNSRSKLLLEQTCTGQQLETQNSCCGSTSTILERVKDLDGLAHESSFNVKLDELSITPESHVTLSPSHQSVSESAAPIIQTKKYACRSSTVFAAQREQRILEKLKNEKFLLKAELHKWLEDVEKDKPATMDRKTLGRCLKKLQDAGSCECIGVCMPSLTNFNNLRYTEVILHPSVSPSQELVQLVYERQRSFDIQCRRSAGSSRLKCEHPMTVLPELTNVKRASPHVDNMPALKAMNANGFVLAKMVRAKLLHNFLWSYLSSLPYWQNNLGSSQKPGYIDLNHEDSRQIFSIDAAVKEMPLELFLQVAGSRLVINNLETRCKLGLRLSDIPVQERRCLLDTQATSRLSSIVGILHRLRLIKLMSKGTFQDVSFLSYALEHHPYLEEPVPAVFSSSDINKTDDCHKLRHNFILSDKAAVDRYWETLEYCFAASDPAYSRKCFPGSVVEEVILRRSWASVRVMTIEQRLELFKRVTISDQTKKIPFCECVKISRELNLTLEQVLRVSYDKRQSRLTDNSYLKSEEWGQNENKKIIGTVSRKRRRLSTVAGCNLPQTLPGEVELIGETEGSLSDIDEHARPVDSFSPYEGENVGLAQLCSAGEQSVDPQSQQEDAETAAFISHCAFHELKNPSKKRFSWTESSDRQLIMQYARHRAMLGARFFRVDWPSLHDLPAQPDACKRRMSTLNREPSIRRAVLRLCSLLGERYTSYLDSSRIKANQKPLDIDFKQSNKDHETFQSKPTCITNIRKLNSQHYCWDDFEDSDIKLALDEVLKYKRLAKMDDTKRVEGKLQQGWTDNSSMGDLNSSSHESEQHNTSSCVGGVLHNDDKKGQGSTALNCSKTHNRSNNNKSHGKFLKFRGKSKISQICESLPVSNAIELLKLVFLSCSKAPGVQNSLARTLQKYHYGDIFAAFNYLREKDYLVIGHGTRPFVLSRKFFHNISSSPFPKDSGKRATDFSVWLKKQQNDLMHDGVAIAPDLQCGEILHLSSLVFSGDISVSPSVAYSDVDVVDDFKSSNFFSLLGDTDTSKSSKRKLHEPCSENFKKPKIQAKADSDRKEKGFPGIRLCLKMESVSGDDIEYLGDGEIHNHALEGDSTSVKDAYCLTSLSDTVAVPLDMGSPSCWDAMTRYFELLSSTSSLRNEEKPSPAVFKSVHSVINQAGKRGLNMDEISGALKIGEEIAEMFVDTLEAFRLAVKVNAFDSIRVVDASFTSKYFISVLEHEKVQNPGILSYTRPQGSSSGASEVTSPHQLDNMVDFQCNPSIVHYKSKASDIDMSNKITMTGQSYTEGQVLEENVIILEESKNEKHVHMQDNEIISGKYPISGTCGDFRPILPWINGDGNINMNVYRGLTRRILGIVMQNPCILEEDIIAKMEALNPQSCRRLLETMLLDNHIRVRWVHQTSSVDSPPSILQNLFASNLRRPTLKLRKHYFANPMSTRML